MNSKEFIKFLIILPIGTVSKFCPLVHLLFLQMKWSGSFFVLFFLFLFESVFSISPEPSVDSSAFSLSALASSIYFYRFLTHWSPQYKTSQSLHWTTGAIGMLPQSWHLKFFLMWSSSCKLEGPSFLPFSSSSISS